MRLRFFARNAEVGAGKWEWEWEWKSYAQAISYGKAGGMESRVVG
jgi:hypothetical protein